MDMRFKYLKSSHILASTCLLLLAVITSCKQQTFNSNSGDGNLGGNDCSSYSGSDLRFCDAQNVILKRCVGCHSGYHNIYASYTEADYKSNFLITAGDSAGSTLFSILLNEGGNMPKDGKPLPDEEYTALMEWIDGASK